MIQRFTFGKPLPTGSTVQELPACDGAVPFLTAGASGLWSYEMAEDTAVYGLGEMPRGINKRGWHYIANNTDEAAHGEDKLSLYAAHNFILVHGGAGRPDFGLFIDYGGKVFYDIGYTKHELFTFYAEEQNYDLYVITGSSEKDICTQLRGLIGRSYIPPKWAFGFAQSRWGYASTEDVREVVRRYRELDMPIDMVCMDIDYMQDYADFTINKQAFPDLAAFSKELRAEGVRLVPIMDAGVREDDNDPTCKEGLEKGYFCKKADGTPFEAAVWPGKAYFADFLRPEVREWFGGRYKVLTDCGIEGFWNDMNEPALFYTPERLHSVAVAVQELAQKGNLVQQDFFAMRGLVFGLQNNPEDYKTFYHEIDGRSVRHDRVHNLYGANMTRAASEAFTKTLRPGKRTLLYSRSSCIGAHRYGGIWLGDNNSSWGQLLANVQMMPNVQMCGFMYSGADLCGFGGNTTPDLALRWLEFGIFTPLMRNHSAHGSREQEYYRFGRQVPAMRNMLKLRYALLPYIYSEFMKAVLEDGFYFKPLAFDYPADAEARGVEDQLLLGDGLMIAPVYVQNATGRHVYLPESMKLLRLRGMNDYDEEVLPAGHHYIHCALDEVLLFIRPGHIVPVASGEARCSAEVDDTHLTLWSYLPDGGKASYTLYSDDGESFDYDNPDNLRVIYSE